MGDDGGGLLLSASVRGEGYDAAGLGSELWYLGIWKSIVRWDEASGGWRRRNF